MVDDAQRPLVVGIAGGTGSGKTTVAERLVRELPAGAVALITHDSYYRDRPDLTDEERAAINFDHPDSLDNALLAEHLDALCAGEVVAVPDYDFVTHRRTANTVPLQPSPVIIVEGILIFTDSRLLDRMDIKLFVDTPDDIRVLRRVRRDMIHRGRDFDSVRRQYYATVRPMHVAFVEPTRRLADVIIPEGATNEVAIDIIVERIRRALR